MSTPVAVGGAQARVERAQSRVARAQSRAEEIANSVTHGVGAAVGVAALVAMVVTASLQGDAFKIVAGAVHGASVSLLFLASTLYHAFERPRLKRVFQVLDHVGIHLLIAGTYTPFALVTLRGAWGWSIFGVVWGLAALGSLFEALWCDRFPRISTALYLATGWVGVIAAGPLVAALPLAGVLWVLAGGLAYTGGVVFFARDRAYDHVIWHLFVLAGALCHVIAVLGYVLR